MNIALDLRRIGNPGIGRYMSCLVKEVLKRECGHEYILLLPADWTDNIGLGYRNVTRLIPKARYYSISEQFELPDILRKHKVDLLHSPHFVLPISRPCPAVVTIHDVIYLACSDDLPSALGRLYYSTMMQMSSRLASRIITDSIFSKEEIVRYLRIDPAKVAVIYPAADANFWKISHTEESESVLAEYGIEGNYILYAGIYKLRKNHAGLLRAFRQYLSFGGEGQLVIAGPMNEGEQVLMQLARELGIIKNVLFTGFIPDSKLCALYSAARAYACPSLYEGFGFTVLEAMACGAPVVCSDAASLPEVAGDAALYANAKDPEAFGKALYQVCSNYDLRQEMAERGSRNLRRFSWEDAATRTLATYDEIFEGMHNHAIAFS